MKHWRTFPEAYLNLVKHFTHDTSDLVWDELTAKEAAKTRTKLYAFFRSVRNDPEPTAAMDVFKYVVKALVVSAEVDTVSPESKNSRVVVHIDIIERKYFDPAKELKRAVEERG